MGEALRVGFDGSVKLEFHGSKVTSDAGLIAYQKRTDLLVLSETGHFHKVEVKAKQGRDWPNCRGIWEEDSFLVFVDFPGKEDVDRPDFYILTPQEWRAVVEAEVERYKAKHPDRRIEINDQNVPVFLDERKPQGRPYQGMGVRPDLILEHQEAFSRGRGGPTPWCWDACTNVVARTAPGARIGQLLCA